MVAKIQSTKNYDLFARNSENRPLDLKKHRKLLESMQQYGYLKCFPIVVRRENGHLFVKDGQHRLAIAQSLGLYVFWVEEDVDFDVAVINNTSKVWALRDYAQKHMANGIKAYQEGLEFAELHGLPIGSSFALLAGTCSFSNCQEAFLDGTFKINDRNWADAVAGIYGPMVAMSSALRTARFLEACMAVCRVKDFSAKRLISGAERCRDLMVSYSTKEAYLDMLTKVYNFGRKDLVGLKEAATMAMRERSFGSDKKKKKNQDAA